MAIFVYTARHFLLAPGPHILNPALLLGKVDQNIHIYYVICLVVQCCILVNDNRVWCSRFTNNGKFILKTVLVASLICEYTFPSKRLDILK